MKPFILWTYVIDEISSGSGGFYGIDPMGRESLPAQVRGLIESADVCDLDLEDWQGCVGGDFQLYA